MYEVNTANLGHEIFSEKHNHQRAFMADPAGVRGCAGCLFAVLDVCLLSWVWNKPNHCPGCVELEAWLHTIGILAVLPHLRSLGIMKQLRKEEPTTARFAASFVQWFVLACLFGKESSG